MTNEATVSVILANWNGARFLDEAVSSVVSQTFRDWELIAVDTGSTDNSPAILTRWARQESRLKPVLLERRLNYPAAINHGLACASGQFVARIESDDQWLPERLASQLRMFADPANAAVGACGSQAILINHQGRRLGLKRFPTSHASCLRAIWYRNPICHSAALIRRAALEQCGVYQERFWFAEDLDLWFRIAQHWQLTNLREPLVCYRIWPGSLSSSRLREVAKRGFQVRAHAAAQFGCSHPCLARAYSLAALGSIFLPPGISRPAFELAIRLVSRLSDASDPATEPIGAPGEASHAQKP
jgi:glycosyltransferase involved in cell wall biosynthesis